MARTIDDNPISEEQAMVRLAIKLGFIAVLGIIFIIMLFGAFYTVGAGERVIVLTFQKPSDNVQGSGLHFKIPIIQSIVRMNIRTQTIHFDNLQGKGDITEASSLFSASKDLQDVQIAIVTNYHIAEKDVLQIYKQYGNTDDYQKNILEPIVRDTVKSISATYTAEELVSKRQEFAEKVATLMRTRFEEKSALFEKVNIVNFQFSDEFTKSIEKKVTAEQDALTQKNKLEQVKYEAEQRIAQANAEASAIAIQMESLRQNGGESYIQLQMLSKWNGVSPQIVVLSGNNVNPIAPFLQLNTNTQTTTK